MLRLTFLGDIFPGDELFTNGFGIKSKTNERHVEQWTKNIADVVGKADYIIGNLESPLVEDDIAKGKTFYGRPIFADVLKYSGVNVLNIANNHILEHGVDGFEKTIGSLHSKGLLTVGEIKNGQSNILTIEKDGTKVCMAGFCDERVCNIENPGCYASLEEATVFETLERMKAMKPDIIAFIFHWGNEYVHMPSLEQRLLSYKLIDRGVNLIVGHHPHVIQPYEKYKHGHIVYSLGNFCFDDVQSNHFGKGMIANVAIRDGIVDDVSFSGILVQDMAFSNYLVRKMNDQALEKYLGEINGKYQELMELPNEEYGEIYQKTLCKMHTRERVLMRLNIVRKVFDVRHQYRKQLLKNIKNYLIR